MRTTWFGACAALSTLVLGTAMGQQKGQYVLGTNGLNAGVMPPPGFSYGNQLTVFSASRFRGPDGVVVPTTGSFDMVLDQNLFVYTSKFKLFGGTFGSTFDLVLANASLTAPVIGVESGGAGVSDIYVQPFALGYHFTRVDLTVGFGFIAPTGRFTPDLTATESIGSGYWGYLPSVGSTIYLSKNKETTLSLFSIYEFHGKKRFTNITPGQAVSFEWGFGQLVPVRKTYLQFGAVGYGQWQTTMNSGSVPPAVRDSMYAVAAIGPQVTFIVPKWNLNVFARYEPEFGASARLEGSTLTIGGAISFPVVK